MLSVIGDARARLPGNPYEPNAQLERCDRRAPQT